MVARNKPNEIAITRVYNAPVEVVWDAWTDPLQAAQWWGPRGFTLTTHSKELRPGGIWHYTMHGPDGTDYPNKTLYHVVELHKKLVYDHGANDERSPLFRVTVLFSESAGKTTMEMIMALPTAEQAEATRKFVKAAGGNATWDRLAEYLDQSQHGKSIFVINRSFAVPVETLFEKWSDTAQLASWLSPTHGQLDYQEIHGPECLVAIQHKSPDTPPIATRIEFTSEGDQATRVTVVSDLPQHNTATDPQTLIATQTQLTRDWTQSFDALETELQP